MAASGSTNCGLDFGTSNSAIGRPAEGRARLVALQDGRASIPTAVFYSFEDGTASFGREAIARYLERDEGRLMRSLKSVLGSSLIHDTTSIKTRRVKFLDIITQFLAFVREAAGSPSRVVMGRPVRFVDDDETADAQAEEQLRRAALQAGFTDVEVQLEPIAAALDYEQRVAREELALVVDIGGGTSDFSIVRVSPERRGRPDRRSDVLSTSGVHVGGTDFDRYLELRTVMPHLGMGSRLKQKSIEPPLWWFHDLSTWQRINFLYEPRVATDIRRVRREALEPEKLDRLLRVIDGRTGHALLAAVEQAKIALSDSNAARLAVQGMIGIEDIPITRAELNAAIGRQVGRVSESLEAVLAGAGLAASAIDAVFLTGGSSRLPLLRAEVRRILPHAALVEGDAFGSVATGLTIDAQNRFGPD